VRRSPTTTRWSTSRPSRMAMGRDVPAAGVRKLGADQPHVRAGYRSAYIVLPRERCRVGYRFSAASPEPFVKMMRPMNASATEWVSFVSIETTTAWGFSGSSPKTFL
jgi:hypothetical protein